MAEKLAIISSFEPLAKGDQFEDFPLHITLMTWFDMPYRQAFINKLQNFAVRYAPQEVVGGDEAMFGENEDVRVRKLKLGKAGSLYAMHSDLLAMITKLDGQVWEGGFIDKNYIPHVTYKGDRGLEEGESVTLNRTQLISGEESGPRTVIADLGLSKGLK